MTTSRPGPVLVTGANSGIGLATALRLAERDWTVYGTVRGDAKADALREAAQERKLGAPRARARARRLRPRRRGRRLEGPARTSTRW